MQNNKVDLIKSQVSFFTTNIWNLLMGIWTHTHWRQTAHLYTFTWLHWQSFEYYAWIHLATTTPAVLIYVHVCVCLHCQVLVIINLPIQTHKLFKKSCQFWRCQQYLWVLMLKCSLVLVCISVVVVAADVVKAINYY